MKHSPKTVVRKGTLFNRRLLDPGVYKTRCSLLAGRTIAFIQEHDLQCVHTFLPIDKNKEPDTRPIIEHLHPKVTFLVSATDFGTRKMTHFRYSESLTLKDDAFGIPTPVSGEPGDLRNANAILIPMVAADRYGNRVGYGKGYYDELLSGLTGGPLLKIGLSLNPPFHKFDFAEPHDIKLDQIVTPFETITCP